MSSASTGKVPHFCVLMTHASFHGRGPPSRSNIIRSLYLRSASAHPGATRAACALASIVLVCIAPPPLVMAPYGDPHALRLTVAVTGQAGPHLLPSGELKDRPDVAHRVDGLLDSPQA